jgi:PKHD-type hydroxylase
LVNHSYYPLIKITDRKPVISVEDSFSIEQLNELLLKLSNEKTHPALTGPEFIDEHKLQERIEESSKVRKSQISFLYSEEYNWVYDILCKSIVHVNLTNYNKVLYGMEVLQYGEYDSEYNGFYGKHCDSRLSDEALTRSLSFSVQLTPEENYTGGDLLIYSDGATYTANKKFGSITFFPAGMIHEVTPVITGFRKSLVGWVLGPRV